MITNDRYTVPKARILSDLHMEGYHFNYEYLGEDMVILAGDIHTQNRHGELFDKIPSNVQILMVSGNHSYYRGEFHSTNAKLLELETKYPNFKFLNNSSFLYNDIYFYGGTMFTDFLLYGVTDQFAMEIEAENGINDFYTIKNGDKTWRAKDHIEQHHKFVVGLKEFLDIAGEKKVIISHFCPSVKSVHPRYGSGLLNGYFAANMEKFMGWKGYWFFGHTHDSFDYKMGETRVICNPKGYGNENVHFDPKLIVPLAFE